MKKVGKIVLIGFVVLILLGGLSSACSKSSSEPASSTAAQASLSSESASSEAAAQEEDAASSSSGAREAMDGFNEKTNHVFEIAGVEFQLPNYYEKGKTNTADSGAITTIYSAESSKDSGALVMTFEQSVPSASHDGFKKVQDDVIKLLGSSNGVIEDLVVSSSEDAEVAGMSGKAFTANGTMKGLPVDERGVVYWNDGIKSVGGLIVFEFGKPIHDYYPDFEKTLNSARAVATSGGENAETEEASAQQEQDASGDVSPDLKEMLDSYEAFMDEYVEFMNSYKESGDAMSMLSQYTEYMQKYTDLMQKIESVDTSNMSAADYAYYIEVTSRVSEKLLKVSVL